MIDLRRFRLRHFLLIGWAVSAVSPVRAEDAHLSPPNTPTAASHQPAEPPRTRSEGFALPPRTAIAATQIASTIRPVASEQPPVRNVEILLDGLIVSEPPAFPVDRNASDSPIADPTPKAATVSVAQPPSSDAPARSAPATRGFPLAPPQRPSATTPTPMPTAIGHSSGTPTTAPTDNSADATSQPAYAAPYQPAHSPSVAETALPFASAYAAPNGELPKPHAADSAAGSTLDIGPQSNAQHEDGEVVSLLSPEYAHLLEADSGFTPTASRRIADHWTPWWRLKRLDLVPKSLSQMSRMWWQNSGRSHSITRDLGIGHERVMFAPSIIDPAIIPAGASIYLQSDRGLNVPDRAAYYWSPNPVGPGFDPEVNTLDTRLQLAVGNRQAMAITEFSMRSLDPTIARNTTGFGDMVVGAQALMLDGKRLKLSSIFRTYLSTGPARRGLGTGHTSLEPGLLARFCLSPRTYLFSEVKYWTPLGADRDYAGDVLTVGFAASTIFRESDVYAVLPTIELRTLTFLFGGQTSGLATPIPPATDTDPILSRYDGRTAVELYPGARIVFGPAGDLGLWELNVAAGVTLAEDHWFDSRLRIGLRWNY